MARRFLLMMSVAAVVLTLVQSPASATQPCGAGGLTTGGRIEQEWVYLGGAGALGNCTTGEQNADRNGKFQVFRNDASGKTAIYWNANVAGGYAKMVRGELYNKWAFYDYERGALGFPTISEAQLATRGGKYNTFEGGSVYWSPETGAHAVFGNIRDQWRDRGYETGTLGYPITDEYELDGGIEQMFQGGTLVYNKGEQPDGDPNDTNARFGADDPRAVALGRVSFNADKPAAQCFATDEPGEKVCARFGSSTETVDDTATNARRGPTTTPSTEAPAPSSAPETSSSAPAASPAPSSATSTPQTVPPVSTTETPSTTTPSSSAPLAPARESASPADSPLTTTTTPRVENLEPARTGSPRVTTALGNGEGPRIVLADAAAPQPNLPGIAAPRDPDRDEDAERNFFSEDVSCRKLPYSEVFYASRFHACAVIPYVFQIIRENADGQPENKGWTKGWALIKQNSEAKSLRTSTIVKFIQRETAGEYQFVTVKVDFKSPTGTFSDGNTSQSGDLSNSPTFAITLTQSSISSNQIARMAPTLTANFFKGGYRDRYNKIDTTRLQQIRCDNMVYITTGQGCVMQPGLSVGQGGRPIMDLGAEFFSIPIDNYRNHILRAGNSLVGGTLFDPLGRYLTRIEYRSKQAGDNRVQACSPARTRQYKPEPKSSWQCDEYPFASSGEGAATSPAGKRTFFFCHLPEVYAPIYPDGRIRTDGYSACLIEAAQNRAGGSIIPTFNRKNRILFSNDDPREGYYVYPRP